MIILNSSVYNLATPQDMTSSFVSRSGGAKHDHLQRGHICMQLVLHSLSLIMLDPSKNTTKKVRFAILSNYYNRYIIFFFSRDTFLTLPMAHVTHYWRYQATVRPPRHSGERGSQWPAALELLFSEMPMVSVERNIITFSAAISVFPDKMLGGDWRLERIHIVVAHLHRNLSNDFWLKGNLRKDRVSKSPLTFGNGLSLSMHTFTTR